MSTETERKENGYKPTYSNTDIQKIACYPVRHKAGEEVRPGRMVLVDGEEAIAIPEPSIDISPTLTLYFRGARALTLNAIRVLDAIILPHIAAHMNNETGYIAEQHLTFTLTTKDYQNAFSLSDRKSARASLFGAIDELYSLNFVAHGKMWVKNKRGKFVYMDYLAPHVSIFWGSDKVMKDGSVVLYISKEFCKYLHDAGFITFLPLSLFMLNLKHDGTALVLGRLLCDIYRIKRGGNVAIATLLERDIYSQKKYTAGRDSQFLREPFIADIAKLLERGILTAARIETAAGVEVSKITPEGVPAESGPALRNFKDFKKLYLKYSLAWYPPAKTTKKTNATEDEGGDK